MVIDSHTHIYSKKVYDEYVAKTKGKVNKIIVFAWNRYFNTKSLVDFASNYNNIFPVGTIDIGSDQKTQLAEMDEYFNQEKIFAIKLYPGYQNFNGTDPRIHPIARLCQKYAKPLIFHSGDFYDTTNTALVKNSHPLNIDELATKFPKCRIIMAHFGFPYIMEAAVIAAKRENVYVDLSGTIDHCEDRINTKILTEQYTADLQRVFAYYPDLKFKTLFGTDFVGEQSPLNGVDPYFNVVEKLFRNKKEKNSVLGGLAEKLFFGSRERLDFDSQRTVVTSQKK